MVYINYNILFIGAYYDQKTRAYLHCHYGRYPAARVRTMTRALVAAMAIGSVFWLLVIAAALWL